MAAPYDIRMFCPRGWAMSGQRIVIGQPMVTDGSSSSSKQSLTPPPASAKSHAVSAGTNIRTNPLGDLWMDMESRRKMANDNRITEESSVESSTEQKSSCDLLTSADFCTSMESDDASLDTSESIAGSVCTHSSVRLLSEDSSSSGLTKDQKRTQDFFENQAKLSEFFDAGLSPSKAKLSVDMPPIMVHTKMKGSSPVLLPPLSPNTRAKKRVRTSTTSKKKLQPQHEFDIEGSGESECKLSPAAALRCSIKANDQISSPEIIPRSPEVHPRLLLKNISNDVTDNKDRVRRTPFQTTCEQDLLRATAIIKENLTNIVENYLVHNKAKDRVVHPSIAFADDKIESRVKQLKGEDRVVARLRSPPLGVASTPASLPPTAAPRTIYTTTDNYAPIKGYLITNDEVTTNVTSSHDQLSRNIDSNTTYNIDKSSQYKTKDMPDGVLMSLNVETKYENPHPPLTNEALEKLEMSLPEKMTIKSVESQPEQILCNSESVIEGLVAIEKLNTSLKDNPVVVSAVILEDINDVHDCVVNTAEVSKSPHPKLEKVNSIEESFDFNISDIRNHKKDVELSLEDKSCLEPNCVEVVATVAYMPSEGKECAHNKQVIVDADKYDESSSDETNSTLVNRVTKDTPDHPSIDIIDEAGVSCPYDEVATALQVVTLEDIVAKIDAQSLANKLGSQLSDVASEGSFESLPYNALFSQAGSLNDDSDVQPSVAITFHSYQHYEGIKRLVRQKSADTIDLEDEVATTSTAPLSSANDETTSRSILQDCAVLDKFGMVDINIVATTVKEEAIEERGPPAGDAEKETVTKELGDNISLDTSANETSPAVLSVGEESNNEGDHEIQLEMLSMKDSGVETSFVPDTLCGSKSQVSPVDSVTESGFSSLKDTSIAEHYFFCGDSAEKMLSKSKDSLDLTDNERLPGTDTLSDDIETLSSSAAGGGVASSLGSRTVSVEGSASDITSLDSSSNGVVQLHSCGTSRDLPDIDLDRIEIPNNSQVDKTFCDQLALQANLSLLESKETMSQQVVGVAAAVVTKKESPSENESTTDTSSVRTSQDCSSAGIKTSDSISSEDTILSRMSIDDQNKVSNDEPLSRMSSDEYPRLSLDDNSRLSLSEGPKLSMDDTYLGNNTSSSSSRTPKDGDAKSLTDPPSAPPAVVQFSRNKIDQSESIAEECEQHVLLDTSPSNILADDAPKTKREDVLAAATQGMLPSTGPVIASRADDNKCPTSARVDDDTALGDDTSSGAQTSPPAQGVPHTTQDVSMIPNSPHDDSLLRTDTPRKVSEDSAANFISPSPTTTTENVLNQENVVQTKTPTTTRPKSQDSHRRRRKRPVRPADKDSSSPDDAGDDALVNVVKTPLRRLSEHSKRSETKSSGGGGSAATTECSGSSKGSSLARLTSSSMSTQDDDVGVGRVKKPLSAIGNYGSASSSIQSDDSNAPHFENVSLRSDGSYDKFPHFDAVRAQVKPRTPKKKRPSTHVEKKESKLDFMHKSVTLPVDSLVPKKDVIGDEELEKKVEVREKDETKPKKKKKAKDSEKSEKKSAISSIKGLLKRNKSKDKEVNAIKTSPSLFRRFERKAKSKSPSPQPDEKFVSHSENKPNIELVRNSLVKVNSDNFGESSARLPSSTSLTKNNKSVELPVDVPSVSANSNNTSNSNNNSSSCSSSSRSTAPQYQHVSDDSASSSPRVDHRSSSAPSSPRRGGTAAASALSPQLYRRVLTKNISSSQESLEAGGCSLASVSPNVSPRKGRPGSACSLHSLSGARELMGSPVPVMGVKALQRNTVSVTIGFTPQVQKTSRTMSEGTCLDHVVTPLSEAVPSDSTSSSKESSSNTASPTKLGKRSASMEILVCGKIREHCSPDQPSSKGGKFSREGSFRLHREISVETLVEIPELSPVKSFPKENYQEYLSRVQAGRESQHSSTWSLCEIDESLPTDDFSVPPLPLTAPVPLENPSTYYQTLPRMGRSHIPHSRHTTPPPHHHHPKCGKKMSLPHNLYLAESSIPDTGGSNPNLQHRSASPFSRGAVPHSSSFTSSPYRRPRSAASVCSPAAHRRMFSTTLPSAAVGESSAAVGESSAAVGKSSSAVSNFRKSLFLLFS